MRTKKLLTYAKKLCALFLTVSMIAGMLPADALASENSTKKAETVSNASASMEDVYILGEVTENRTKFSKEFRLSNGLGMTTLYAGAVHYQKNGEWKEIDNTLRLESRTSGKVYANKDAPFQVSFPQNMTQEAEVTVTKDGYELVFYMDGELYDTENTKKRAFPDSVTMPFIQIRTLFMMWIQDA